jgi:hypothetical protein
VTFWEARNSNGNHVQDRRITSLKVATVGLKLGGARISMPYYSYTHDYPPFGFKVLGSFRKNKKSIESRASMSRTAEK